MNPDLIYKFGEIFYKLKHLLFLLCISVIVFSCAKKQQQTSTPADITLQKATTYRDSGKKDSAFLYYSKAKDQYLQTKDSVGAGVCLVNMGILSTDLGDVFGGQELALEALAYFDDKNPTHGPYLLSNYNNLGIACFNLQDYEKSVEFYQKCLNFITDSTYARVVKNNIANAYRKEGKYKEAIDMYGSALVKETEPRNYARLLSNQAYARWLDDPVFNAATDLRKALSIRVSEKDTWGQNSSYDQLADYYMKSQPDSALELSGQMYEGAVVLGSADNQIDALEKLIRLSGPTDAKRYFERYQQVKDSVQTARNNAKNQFVLVRYETEKNKADNLQLQQANTVRTFWIISLVALFIVSSVVGAVWYRKRKQRLELEAKNAIRESQLNTSKKVHDVVANGLYRLMSEMENKDEFDQDKILNNMELLYEQSRDISYDNDSGSDTDFQETNRHLLMSFATANTKIAVVGNNDETWQGVSSDVKHELKHVLQELMVNMKKHSQARAVSVKFAKEGNELSIWYTDNGVGMPVEAVNGNGLTNTGNRIKSMGGSLNFGAGTGGELTIHLKIPSAQKDHV